MFNEIKERGGEAWVTFVAKHELRDIADPSTGIKLAEKDGKQVPEVKELKVNDEKGIEVCES